MLGMYIIIRKNYKFSQSIKRLGTIFIYIEFKNINKILIIIVFYFIINCQFVFIVNVINLFLEQK